MVHDMRNGKDLKMPSQSYNTGVLGLNLKKWREKNLTNEVLYWMCMNKKTRLWNLGTQPIIYIVAGDDWNRVDERWNVNCYNELPSRTLEEAYILHWTGECMIYFNKRNLFF